MEHYVDVSVILPLLIITASFAALQLLAHSPSQADPHLLAQFAMHDSLTRGTVTSADGSIVASYDGAGTLRLWRSDRRKLIGTLPGVRALDCVALSEDGQTAVTAAADGLRVWDINSQRVKLHFDNPSGTVTSLAVSPLKTFMLSGSSTGRIILWDLVRKQSIRSYVHTGATRSLAFLPDNVRFISGDSRGKLRLWDATRGHELANCASHSTGVRAIAATLKGDRLLSCGDDGTLCLWNTQNLRLLRRLTSSAEHHALQAIAMSVGGTRAIASDASGTLRLWSCESGEILENYSGFASPCTSCAFLANGSTVLSGGSDGTVCFWRIPPPDGIGT